MQLIVELQVKVTTGSLGAFTDELYRHGCRIQRLHMKESAEEHEIYDTQIIYSDPYAYEAFLAGASDAEPDVEVTPADTWILIYTSGTTGKPKARAFSTASSSD